MALSTEHESGSYGPGAMARHTDHNYGKVTLQFVRHGVRGKVTVTAAAVF